MNLMTPIKMILETGIFQQHVYIHTYTYMHFIKPSHSLTATGYETSHLTPYTTNVQSVVNIVSQ